MKKKEIIGAILIALVFVGGAAGYKLISEKKESKAAVQEKENKSNSRVKDLTGEKPKAIAGKIDYKKLYTTPNKEGNTAGNSTNMGWMAQQEKCVFFNDGGLCMALTDLKTGWKKINNDNARSIQVIGEWIYYDTSSGQLVKVKADGSNKKILQEKVVGKFKVKDDWIYFVQGEQLCKMKTDGTERTLIMESEGLGFSALQDNYIYYSKNTNKDLWRVYEDGTCDEKIVENIAFNIISGEWIYYMDFNQGFYKVKLDGTSKTKVIDDRVDIFNIEGDCIYYITKNVSKSTYELCKVKSDGTEKTKIYDLKKIGSNGLYSISITSENVCLFTVDGKSIYKLKK